MVNISGCSIPEAPAEDFEYKFEDGCVIITGYKGTAREIRVPEKIDGRDVTIIGKGAFEKYDLTKIYLPENLLIIKENAFRDCECLEEIVFSDSLERIDRYAFHGCNKLEKIDLPESILTISDSAFSYCKSLKKVILPSNLERLGASSFANCENLTELKIPENTYADIKYGETLHTIAGFYVTVESPVGSGTYFENDNIKKSKTKMIVKAGSDTHQKLLKCKDYFNFETY